MVIIEEICKDLFSCDETDSLVHCVSRDFHMGKGIAVEFKRRFKRQNILRNQNKGIGDVAFLNVGKRRVYYLITKEFYYQKPKFEDLKRCLKSLEGLTREEEILSMPKIGCGLDGLKWEDVKKEIEHLPRKVKVYFR